MRVNKDLKRTSILILESSHTFSHSPLAQTAASLSQRAISSHSPEKKKQNIRFLQGISGITWAVGKTSIEKCDLRVKVIVFGSSLYRFTVYPDCIICIPWQTACGKPFYTSTSASEACLTTLRFLLQRSNCMVCYDTCQCNCKSQLHHPFSNSETSLNSVVGRSGWALTATCSMPFIHSPASG